MDKTKCILEKAKRVAESTKTWADLSNALFDPLEGLIVQTFRDSGKRAEFRKSDAYNELHMLVESKMKATGLINGATPKKSGKFVVRLPRSLHAALEREAKAEATSLNQLVVAKLAIQLDDLASDPLSCVIQAYAEVREGYSEDRVIADPDMDRRFLERCRDLGLSGTDLELNWKLMNARKASNLSYLKDLVKTKRFTLGKCADEFEYASELAVRHLQTKRDVSLDQIICDPELAEEFDECASLLAPGFSSLEYRWAAFALRKSGRLSEKQKKQVACLPELRRFKKISSLKLSTVPDTGGVYLFKTPRQSVFLSQTDNLRHRLERHLEVSDSRGLPDWLWDVSGSPLSVSFEALPGVRRSVRQAIEVLLAREWKPTLNFQRKVA